MDYKHTIALISAIALVLIGIFFYLKQNPELLERLQQSQQQQVQESESQKQEEAEKQESSSEEQQKEKELDITTKDGLQQALKQSAEKESYEQFAQYLKMVYDNRWQDDQGFSKIESETYMYVTEQYFDKGDWDRALEIGSIVQQQVPFGWRFRYLKIRTLETQGRDAYEKDDLALAEQKALDILKIMYRREGADLLADIYIKKIEANIKNADKQTALNNIYFIWDYEVSDAQRQKLTELRNTTLIMQ